MSPKELGALAPGCEAKIMSDNGKFLGSGEVGEMLVKTPTIMKGKENNNKLLFQSQWSFYLHTKKNNLMYNFLSCDTQNQIMTPCDSFSLIEMTSFYSCALYMQKKILYKCIQENSLQT